MKNVVIKPLGRVLERAGLITDWQIRQALAIQTKKTRVKFGTILVSQGILKQKNVDFFAEQLPEILQKPRSQPLGYYLQQAGLIDSQQIDSLLEEQKHSGLLLGELIVDRGLLSEKTVDFFLQCLERTEKNKKLLSPSYRGIVRSLNLETKAASPYALLKEVFDWTGGHPLLTQQLCKIISDSNSFIPNGLEAIAVKQIVEKRVINNWETQAFGEYLKTIQEHLFNNTVCLPKALLNLYLKVLQQGEVSTNSTPEEQELLKLGLVIERDNKLQVANRIYRTIFNRDWVVKQLQALAENSLQLSKANAIQPNRKLVAITKAQNEPLTKIAALTILTGLLFISPLVIFFNNSQPKLWQVNNRTTPQFRSRSALCTEPIPADLSDREAWLRTLRQEEQRLQQQFPQSCQNNLDKLIVLNAIQLGKENRVLDGIYALCQVSPTSQSFDQAQFWLERWSNSVDWGNLTQSYLRLVGNCPVAEN